VLSIALMLTTFPPAAAQTSAAASAAVSGSCRARQARMAELQRRLILGLGHIAFDDYAGAFSAPELRALAAVREEPNGWGQFFGAVTSTFAASNLGAPRIAPSAPLAAPLSGAVPAPLESGTYERIVTQIRNSGACP
jgi:hypothetical protein